MGFSQARDVVLPSPSYLVSISCATNHPWMKPRLLHFCRLHVCRMHDSAPPREQGFRSRRRLCWKLLWHRRRGLGPESSYREVCRLGTLSSQKTLHSAIPDIAPAKPFRHCLVYRGGHTQVMRPTRGDVLTWFSRSVTLQSSAATFEGQISLTSDRF
ncbi:hypothetical protein B0J13DRAFT_28052 [Dactylonectria estremocensis]|uniref:Uncharacterized protein n=1 Tax=Dactylonectria estremocensis TaxID=1079267 RepID=A0A9P9FJZ7_9HYPO|nr:hypothetical protein B0J13DRAFT_28052 [Dactylonectria estremocensis]